MNQKKSVYFIHLALAVLGAVVAYITVPHQHAVDLSGASDALCNINALFNCDDVARSPYAKIANIPLGVWGVGYFIGCFVLVGLAGFTTRNQKESWQTYTLLVLIGCLSSIVLAVVAFTQVGSLCLYCMIVYLITGLQLAALFPAGLNTLRDMEVKGVFNGGFIVILCVATTVTTYNLFYETKPSQNTDLKPTDSLVTAYLAPTPVDLTIRRSRLAGYGEDFRIGPDTAKITIVDFADFQCPVCRRAAAMLSEVKKAFGEEIQVVFKNFPLNNACNPAISSAAHPLACKAAVLGRCAGASNQFWAFHDAILLANSDLSESILQSATKASGLPAARVEECLDPKGSFFRNAFNKIKEDAQQGVDLRIEGTPTLFINKRRYIGPLNVSVFTGVIRELLAAQP